MMLINMEITLGVDLNVHQRMARQLIEHMVEKADSRRNFARADSFDRELHRNVSFFRFTLDLALARHIFFPLPCGFAAFSKRRAISPLSRKTDL
jgi:hypothetical protein